MFENIDTTKIDKYIKEKINIILEFEFDGLILLFGGGLKDLVMDKKNVRDLDFLFLTKKEGNIKDFIRKYNLNAKKNKYFGYNIIYNGISIDITCVNDLYKTGHYSTDFLFYDIKRKILIPIGIKRTLKKNAVIDYCYNGYYKPKRRLKKAKEFVRFMNNKRYVRVIYNYFRPFHILKSFLLHPDKLFIRR